MTPYSSPPPRPSLHPSASHSPPPPSPRLSLPLHRGARLVSSPLRLREWAERSLQSLPLPHMQQGANTIFSFKCLFTDWFYLFLFFPHRWQIFDLWSKLKNDSCVWACLCICGWFHKIWTKSIWDFAFNKFGWTLGKLWSEQCGHDVSNSLRKGQKGEIDLAQTAAQNFLIFFVLPGRNGMITSTLLSTPPLYTSMTNFYYTMVIPERRSRLPPNNRYQLIPARDIWFMFPWIIKYSIANMCKVFPKRHLCLLD